MLATILAAIIIILLIIYAAYPLLSNKDFHGWASIALTALILFTVIITLFVILGNRKGQHISLKPIPTVVQETNKTNEPNQKQEPEVKKEEPIKQTNTTGETVKPATETEEEMSDEEALMSITKEYLEAEEAFKAQGEKDYQQKAAQQIIDRYELTEEEWQMFLQDAAKYDLFNRAKAEMKK